MICAGMLVRARAKSDEPAVTRFLRPRHSEVVARLGRLERSLDHPALVVEEGGALAVSIARARARGEISLALARGSLAENWSPARA